MARVRLSVAHSVLIGFLLAFAGEAFADPLKCQRSIAKASSKFAQDKAKALQACEDRKAASKLPPGTECLSESKTATKIQKASAKLAKSVSKDCGGKDKTCGTGDDDSLASIGWGSVTTCPNFENGSCNGPITHCGDIATCLTCVDEAAVDQAIDLYYDDLDSGQFGSNSPTNKCQRSIGKETVKFLRSKSKALQKCWDARVKNKHANECPNPGDGKAVRSIQKAEDKKVANICKACGGGNKVCGGGDDLTPGQIGFASSCPDVTIPEGSSCGGAIVDLQDIVDCVDCVTEFKVDCMDRLTVPQFESYPTECNGEAPTTTTTSTTSTTTQPGTCGNGVLDPGEECDASSPSGAFCPPGEVCSGACTCDAVTTTTETPTTTTTTTQPGTCGNGVLDPGEECDASSPAGAFCPPFEACSGACTCDPSTTTTGPTTSTTSSSTSTTTTQPGTCGNGVLDPGEECDASSPGGAFSCPTGEECSPGCTCETITTTTEPTTTTTDTTSTSTSTSTSGTDATTSSSTTTLPPYGSPSRAFLSTPSGLLD